MKRAKSILYGATALAIAAGSAIAQPSDEAPSDETSMVYSVDEDRDGRADREIELQQSDAMA